MVSGMSPRTADTETFWKALRRHAGLESRQLFRRIVRRFSRDATELADLAIAGSKGPLRLARDYGPGREPMPKPCDFVTVLDGEARPRSIWRTTEVTIEPLSQADESFAWDEGGGTTRERGAQCPLVRGRGPELSGEQQHPATGEVWRTIGHQKARPRRQPAAHLRLDGFLALGPHHRRWAWFATSPRTCPRKEQRPRGVGCWLLHRRFFQHPLARQFYSSDSLIRSSPEPVVRYTRFRWTL
jgi:hypothetical protein